MDMDMFIDMNMGMNMDMDIDMDLDMGTEIGDGMDTDMDMDLEMDIEMGKSKGIDIDTCSRHGFSYIRGWMQIVLAPNDLFSWNNKTNTMSPTHSHVSSWAMHVNLLCACSHLEAMKG